MKAKKRFFSLLLAVCLAAGLMPTAAFAAEDDKAVMLGTGGISGYDSAAGYDYIYFGYWTAQDTYTTSGPIKWRVLDDRTNTGENGLFLLSEELLGTGNYGGVYFQQSYHYDSSSGSYHKGSAPANGDHTDCLIANAWQGSDAQTWCATFYSNNFSTGEQSAVLGTTKSDGAFTSSTYNVPFAASESILNGDKVFFLSAQEAENSAYGFTDDAARIANYGGNAGVWWLRSPNASLTSAGSVSFIGNVSLDYVITAWAARPAFNLDLNSVLFTSAAAGGKSASGMDSGLTAVDDYTGSEWKLTLLDSSRNGFSANGNGQTSISASAGDSVQITYSGARTGANEYVSALLCDSNGNVLYYGNIARNSASGTAALNIPAGLAAGSYTLKVFSEQCNGDYKTDYASAMQEISLNITLPQETTPQAVFTAAGDNSGTLSNVDASMKYSTDGGASWTDITGATATVTGVTADKDIQIVKKGDGTATADSDAQIIDVTQAAQPAGIGKTDCTTAAQNDGTITGVDSAMEYKPSAASDWIAITSTEITGLEPGAYQVRVKANGNVLASEATTVTIGAHICAAQGEWQHDANNLWKLCSCGEKLNEAAHTFQWVIDNEATAAEAGSKHEECTVCGYAKAAEEIPATGETASPQTGDDSNIALWIAAMLASGAALTGTVLYSRKRKYGR